MPSNQPNSAGVPSGGDPQNTPLPQAKPWQAARRLRKHEEEEEEARKDSGSLRADTPEAAGGLQQKQRLGREAPQDTERLPSTHLGLRN